MLIFAQNMDELLKRKTILDDKTSRLNVHLRDFMPNKDQNHAKIQQYEQETSKFLPILHQEYCAFAYRTTREPNIDVNR